MTNCNQMNITILIILFSSLSAQLTEDIIPGPFTDLRFKGIWVSEKEKQGNFLFSNEGLFFLHFRHGEALENKLNFAFWILEDSSFEGKLLVFNSTATLTSSDQHTFIFSSNTNVTRFNSIVSENGVSECQIDSEISMFHDNGSYLPVNTKETSKVHFRGKILSKDCGIELRFDTGIERVNNLLITFYTICQIMFISLGTSAFWKAIRTEDLSQLMNLSNTVLIINITIDEINVHIMIALMMVFLPQYTIYFLVIFMISIFTIAIKIRFLLQVVEDRFNRMPPEDARGLLFAKIVFFAEVFLFFIGAGSLSTLLIFHKWLHILLFLYPIIQIIYNCRYVTKRNSFMVDVHLSFFGAQMFLPIFLRLTTAVFNLRQDLFFCFILISFFIIQMLILILQKTCGPSFFLPKQCRPNYYEYSRVLTSETENLECSICFCKLHDSPTTEQHSLETSILLKSYYQTPCGHQFHESCLTEWMNIRLACPCCRMSLPIN